MKRKALSHLLVWKEQPHRKPLVMRGIRQCGKTWLVRELGKTYPLYVEINFEKNPDFREVFKKNLDPSRILKEIEIRLNLTIRLETTLIFFDEIQVCPQALLSLRYFYEELPQLAVIGAGSLLQLAIEEVGMPVGRVEFFHVYPMTFLEFLEATDASQLHDWILNDPELDSLVLHQQSLDKLSEYLLVGGMPEAQAAWRENRNPADVMRVHQSLIETYQQDFPKYARKNQIKYVDEVFKAIPRMIGKKWIYTTVSTDHRSRELAPALGLLKNVHVAIQVTHTSVSSPPLGAIPGQKKFKVLLADIGLTQSLLGLRIGDWVTYFDRTLANRGELVEAMVGQEILASSTPYLKKELFTWMREKPGSNAEVDYIETLNGKVYPIEVKAGRGDHLRSLRQFQEERNITRGVVFSADPYCEEGELLRMPLYAIGRLFLNAQ